jgi:hypothetical protein
MAIRSSVVKTQGSIFDKYIQVMTYADDVVITGRRLQGGEEVFTSLIEQRKKMGLEINKKRERLNL